MSLPTAFDQIPSAYASQCGVAFKVEYYIRRTFCKRYRCLEFFLLCSVVPFSFNKIICTSMYIYILKCFNFVDILCTLTLGKNVCKIANSKCPNFLPSVRKLSGDW